MKQLDIGIDLENGRNCILLFADDIVILAVDEIKLQSLLDFTNELCHKWKSTMTKERLFTLEKNY